MDWSKGFSSRYYISVIDRNTWRDKERLEITGGSIRREDSDLRESANVDAVNYPYDTEQIIRVWLDAKQDGNSSHTPLFTGLATCPGKKINGRRVTNTLECYSVLKIAQDVLLPRGWYAAKGLNGGDLIKDLLSILPVSVTVDSNPPSLKYDLIAENGENHLSMANKILDLMNWRMTIDGYGNIFIRRYGKNPVSYFHPTNNDILEPSLSVDNDWYSCPNVYRAISGDSYAISRDSDPNSPLSTVRRKREVWIEDASARLQANESLQEYADKMLKISQQTAMVVNYDRRFDPNVHVLDIVNLNYPAQGLVGNFLVTSQSITLSYNAKTSEEVVKL